MAKIAKIRVRVVHHGSRARVPIVCQKLAFWIAAVILPWAIIIALGYWFIHSFG